MLIIIKQQINKTANARPVNYYPDKESY